MSKAVNLGTLADDISVSNGSVSLATSEIILPKHSTDPSNPVEGQIYYNTTDGFVKFYKNSNWILIDTVADGSSASSAAISGNSIKNTVGSASGYYWIQTPSGPMQTYVDMSTIDGGGWTLIGKSGGGSWHGPDSWLKSSVGTMTNISSPGTNSYACIDSRAVAGTYALEVMISNFAMNLWVKSPIHTEATESTIFNHADGASAIENEATNNSQSVTATAWNGSTQSVYVNKYMIMAYLTHGGSTPAWAINAVGNTSINDYAMAVACCTTDHNGYTGGASNGRDAPYNSNDTGWPNDSYSTGHFYGLVWVR